MDNNLEKLIQTNKKLSKGQFFNFISGLVKDFNSNKYSFNDSDKTYSKNKVIILDILKKSVNISFNYSINKMNYNSFISALIELFNDIVKNEIFTKTNDTKEIINDLANYLNFYLKNLNNIKSILPNSFDSEKNDTVQLKNELNNLNKIIEDYKIRYEQKENEFINTKVEKENAVKEIEDVKNQKEELENTLKSDKSKYENEIKEMRQFMKTMKKQYYDLEKKYNNMNQKNIEAEIKFNEKYNDLEKKYNNMNQKNIEAEIKFNEKYNDLEKKYNDMKQKNIEMEIKFNEKYNDLEKTFNQKYNNLEKEYNDVKRQNELINNKIQMHKEVTQTQSEKINMVMNSIRELWQMLDNLLNILNDIIPNLRVDEILLDIIYNLF